MDRIARAKTFWRILLPRCLYIAVRTANVDTVSFEAAIEYTFSLCLGYASFLWLRLQALGGAAWHMHQIIASLSCHRIIYTQAYRPMGHGKIETFNRSIRGQFLAELKATPVRTLDELNEAFSAWIPVLCQIPASRKSCRFHVIIADVPPEKAIRHTLACGFRFFLPLCPTTAEPAPKDAIRCRDLERFGAERFKIIS